VTDYIAGQVVEIQWAIMEALGLCKCGRAPVALGLRDRCEECWQKDR
jgi:hypothetical protein